MRSLFIVVKLYHFLTFIQSGIKIGFMHHDLYIHVPFCVSKCGYCAFHSTVTAPDWKDYAANVTRDIEFWAKRLSSQVPDNFCAGAKISGMTQVPTVFFGGGTPSLMPGETFAQIMDAVRKNFDVAKTCEITIEANPGTIDTARLQEFINAGANRISIGVQSLDDDVLKFLGRRNEALDARKLVAAAQNSGIRVSCDFIYGLPNQTVQDVRKMCRDILDLGISHASLYELSIEPGTPFAAQNIQVPANETCAEMYNAIGEEFLPRYEISNYAAPGHECRHNQNIWAGEPYIGIGPSAAGRIFTGGQWFETIDGKIEAMDAKTRGVEKIILGLRTVRGVALTDDVRAVIDWNFVNNNMELFIITPPKTSCGSPPACQAEPIPPHQGAGKISLAGQSLLVLDSLLPKIIGIC